MGHPPEAAVMKSGENVIKLRYHAMRTFRGNEGQSGEEKKITERSLLTQKQDGRLYRFRN
jgi:hypothetical protein